MILMLEIGDRAAQGRACGNLGNVHYLLGNFPRAIHYHTERLKIATDFEDKAAERRAHSNLGNANIFMGEFDCAVGHYKQTLQLARELGDRAVEAQACYSLGNTYTLLKDYPRAVEFHLYHLRIAQELFDKVGEGRACWSLGNAHSAMGQHEEAYHYAVKHLEISRETGDRMGQATAQLNISELSRILGYPEGTHASVSTPAKQSKDDHQAQGKDGSVGCADSCDNTNTPVPTLSDSKAVKNDAVSNFVVVVDDVASVGRTRDDIETGSMNGISGFLDEEDFFDFISRFQSKRMDDQRCSLNIGPLTDQEQDPEPGPESPSRSGSMASLDPIQKEELIDMIAGVQSHRMNEQRASAEFLPGKDDYQSDQIGLFLKVLCKIFSYKSSPNIRQLLGQVNF